MNSLEISKTLDQLKLGDKVLGVFASNQIPSCEVLSLKGLVTNTDPSHERGTHWLALLDTGDTLEFFDTFGLSLDTYPIVFDYVIRCKARKIRRVLGRIQSYSSNACGLHCLLFLALRNNGVSMNDIVTKVYTDNLTLNDCIALEYLTSKYYVDSNNLMSLDLDYCK